MAYERLKKQFADLIKISNMGGSGSNRTTYGPNTFKVDRRSSVLGNPFSMQDESQRMNVLEQYYDYFTDITSHNIKGQPFPEDSLADATKQAMASLNTPYWVNKRGGSIVTGQSFMDGLREIARQANLSGQPIELADWCAPNACHAETIGNFLGPYIQNNTQNPISNPGLLDKVISGGQTGADILGLQLAQKAGIPVGGTMSKNYYGTPLIESNDGIDRSSFGFTMLPYPGNMSAAYRNRTAANAMNADGTVYFRGPETSSGFFATRNAVSDAGKQFLDNPQSADELYDWIVNNNIKTLNVAGNRGSTLTDADRVRMTDILNDVFSRSPSQVISAAAPVAQAVAAATPDPTDDVVAQAITSLNVADVINHPTFGEGIITGIDDGVADVDFNGNIRHLGIDWILKNLLNK